MKVFGNANSDITLLEQIINIRQNFLTFEVHMINSYFVIQVNRYKDHNAAFASEFVSRNDLSRGTHKA